LWIVWASICFDEGNTLVDEGSENYEEYVNGHKKEDGEAIAKYLF
jgi:hypothetical protein